MGTHQEEWEEWNNLFKSKKKKSRNVVVEEGVCADWHWHWHWLGSTGGGTNLKVVVDPFVGSRHTC